MVDISAKNRQLISIALYALSGIIYLILLIESICTLLNIYILNKILSKSMNYWLYNFFLEAGILFRERPILIPISFVIFFIAYIIMGLSMYYKSTRNKTICTVALGFLIFSIIMLMYTFWELILKYVFVLFIILITIFGLTSAYFLAPWEDWTYERIYNRISQIIDIINQYQNIVQSFEKQNIDQSIIYQMNNTIRNYIYELNSIERSLLYKSEDIKLLELKTDTLYNHVIRFKDINTGKNILDSIEKSVIGYIKECLSDKRFMIVALLTLSKENVNKILKLKEG